MDEIYDIGNSYMCDCRQPGCSYCDQDGSLADAFSNLGISIANSALNLPDIKSMTESDLKELAKESVNDKRLQQKKESWINNIMKVLGKTREEAEEMYNKIKPYEKDLDKN